MTAWLNRTGSLKCCPDYPGEQVSREKAGVFRIEAEDYLVQVTGKDSRVMAPLFHISNNFAEYVGGFPGDVLQRPVRAELVGVEEDVFKFDQIIGLVKIGHRDLVKDGFHPGKVGADPYGLEGGDNKERWGLQIDLIAE